MAQAIKEAEAKVGAPIKVGGFVRYALGEGIDRPSGDFGGEVAAWPARIKGTDRRRLLGCARRCRDRSVNRIQVNRIIVEFAAVRGTIPDGATEIPAGHRQTSGEALSGPEKFGMHQPTIDRFATDLVASHALGIALGVVVGGGNVLRGAQISENGLSRPTADAMGMLATVMNALVHGSGHRARRRQRPRDVGADHAEGLRNL